MFKYQVSRNLAVTSIHGDITKVKADAVVTGEGPDLLTDGYVTQSLIKANPQLQKKRRLLRETYGKLGLWTVQSTELGHPFKYVIHAVLDRGTDSKWLKDMKTLYKRIFIEAERLKISSIAVPLLGAGTGDTERSLSIQAVARSVVECTPNYPTDMMFVSKDTKVLDMFVTQITFEQREESEAKDHCSFFGFLWSMFAWIWGILSLRFIDNQQHRNECKSQIRGKRYEGYNKQHLHTTAPSARQPNKNVGYRNHARGNRHSGQQGKRNEVWDDRELQLALQKSKEEGAKSKKHHSHHASRGRMSYPNSYNHSLERNMKEKSDLEKAIQLSKADLKRESSSTLESAIHSCTSNGDCNSFTTDPATDEDSDIEVIEENEKTDTTSDKEKEPKDFEISHNGASNSDGISVGREDTCPICLGDMIKPKRLDKCGHIFCEECIDRSFENFKPVCPSCNMVYGVVTGNQPDGTMDVGFSSQSLPGYSRSGTIKITYIFPVGKQKEGHPSPGQSYKGTTRRAYLPDNKEGNAILTLLRTAFDRKLTFTIGRSTTTGRDGVVTWNDIHHKTNMDGGPTRFGYPDPSYLSRVRDELASKGVTDSS